LGLIERTEGNPFFLEESVRTLIETQVLVGERGAFRLSKPHVGIQVPPTVQAVLAARIDRLPVEGKALLQIAAVIGKDVPFALLQAIAEVQEEQLRHSLVDLQAADFFYEAQLFPEPEYTFKHALTHEVAYGSVLHDRRRALHADIVEAIERLYSDSLTDKIGHLAHHAFHGHVWDRAVTYLRQAGAKAASASAHREAVACFEQALVALQHLPQDTETLEQAIDLRFHLRTSLIPLGEFKRIFEYLRQAEQLAKDPYDQGRLGRTYAYLTDYFREIGEYDRAIEYGQRAVTIAESYGDAGLQVATNIYFGQVYHNMGQYRLGSNFLRSNVKSLSGGLICERFGLPYLPSVHSRTWLVWCLVELGELAEAATAAEEGLRIAEAEDHPTSLTCASAYSGLSRVLLRKGDVDRAIPFLERGLQLTSVSNLRLWCAHFLGELGYAYALSGRLTEAFPLLRQALEQWSVIRGTAGQSIRLVSLSEAYLLTGRIAEALELADHAMDLARNHNERGNQAYVLRMLAEIASHRDPPDIDNAESGYRRAIGLTHEPEMRLLLAHCHLGLGKLHRWRANRSGADEHLTIAAALFRAMQMPFCLQQTEAELRRLR